MAGLSDLLLMITMWQKGWEVTSGWTPHLAAILPHFLLGLLEVSRHMMGASCDKELKVIKELHPTSHHSSERSQWHLETEPQPTA